MVNAKSLLDSLTGGQGVRGLADKAKAGWEGQSALGKGAIAGGLLGILATSGGRRLLGTGVKVGGAALIGGLAYQAWQDWKSGKVASGAEPGLAPEALPAPDGLGVPPADDAMSNELATKLVQAMVAAAKADGHVTPDERTRIDQALARAGLETGAADLLRAELDAPLDVRRIAALAANQAEAAQIYAASLVVVDQQSLEEKGYLAMLAAALSLEDGLVRHLNAQATAALG